MITNAVLAGRMCQCVAGIFLLTSFEGQRLLGAPADVASDRHPVLLEFAKNTLGTSMASEVPDAEVQAV
jgi:hypothetical protein